VTEPLAVTEAPVPAAAAPVPVLSARGLGKVFHGHGIKRSTRAAGTVAAVVDVDLDLFAGHTVALVGESGSGKSTIARMLAQLTKPSVGEILLRGTPIAVKGGRARRRYARSVQLLFQDPFSSFNPVHRLRYELTRVVKLHRDSRRKEIDGVLGELLRTVQLSPPDEFLDKFPHQLSGGQLQRIAIARTLAASPQVLLLDEPVSMLDVSIRLGVLNLLNRLKEQEQLAMLYITHDIASARYFADSVQVMYRGHVVESGPAEAVTQNPAHPYTQLLIAASPDPARRHAPVAEVPRPSGAVDVAAGGCPFTKRCPFVMPKCAEMPPKFELGPEHRAACWLHE
jgi:peptide/nickel transport system ATP-binding protein